MDDGMMTDKKPLSTNDCLIVVDFQKGFLPDDVKCQKRAQQVNENIEGLIETFTSAHAQIVFTKFANHKDSNFTRFLGWHDLESDEEQEFAICPPSDAIIIVKDTYGLTNDAISQLKDQRITNVYMCGMDTEACVLAIAYEMFDAGFGVHIIEDACMSSGGNTLHECSIDIASRSFGSENVISGKDLHHDE